MAPPPEKKQKTSEKEEDAAEKKEEPKELEEDMKKDSAPKIQDKVKFLTPDTTMNVMPSTMGNMLVPMTEGGLSHLVAGARANVGIKSGRYMFEVKIIEEVTIPEGAGPKVKPMTRVGFSAEGSLFLGEDDNSVCFDNEGMSVQKKARKKCSQPFGRDVLVAVVLNLDEKSPNFNTISLFRDGVRASQPQPLPDNLKGQTLFPAVSFKGTTVHTNFGAPVVPLPFKCKVLQDASQKEASVTKYTEPEDGKYTVLFPVSMPDEGSFDWLDNFLEKNPSYTELSDRAFVDWAIKSGHSPNGKRVSNDKPEVGFQIKSVGDTAGIKRVLMQIAPLQPRNFVVMEVKGNLSKEDRAASLAKFKSPVFKTTAEILVGDPPSSFKKRVLSKTLSVKQEASDREFKVKKLQEKREWEMRKKKKEAERQKLKLEKERKKKLEEVMKKREAEMKKKAKELEKKKQGEKKDGDKDEESEEEKKEEKAVEEIESEPEADEPEPADEEPPKVSLTDEEKKIKFFKHAIPDLAPAVFNTQFSKFTLPGDDEGFDRVKYSWLKESESTAYVKEWVLERKLTTRVEDIVPSAWFKQKWGQWGGALKSWKDKQNEYKAKLSKKAAEKVKKAADKAAKAAKKLAAEKKAKLEAEKKAKEIEEKKAKGEEVPEEKPEEKAPVVVESEEEPEEEEPELDFEGIDIFGVEDILDIGNGVPLFKDFLFEDFAMLALRYELHLLAHAFSKDCNDPERTGIYLEHLPFYYQKYFSKNLNIQSFGVKTVTELVALVDDAVMVTKQNVIESMIPADLDSNAVFVKITEEARRTRLLLVDMGEESARLKIQGGPREQNQGGQAHEKKDNAQAQKSGWGGNEGNKGWGKNWGGKGGAHAGGKIGKGGWGGGWQKKW